MHTHTLHTVLTCARTFSRRTDFKKNSLSAVDALSSWWNVALANSPIADSQLYQRLADGPEDWGQVRYMIWFFKWSELVS